MPKAPRVERLVDGPIIPPPHSWKRAATHQNTNGPSLVRVPDWVSNPLGRYYLYYADHKGSHIRLAFANDLTGPWQSHQSGALDLSDTPFAQTEPEVPPHIDPATLADPRGPGVPSPLDDCTIPHIASPEVIVDEATRSIRLYYHGLDCFMRQITRVATSHDGLIFEARNEILTPPYLRVFPWRSEWIGLAMPGTIWRSADGLSNFEAGPQLFEPDMRHAGLRVRGDMLQVFWTRVGDAPERILLSEIELTPDWTKWRKSESVEVLRPERPWEGAREPVEPSLRSSIDRPVNQLRDPFIFEDEGQAYLVYAVAGEAGLGIARLLD
jgi:hypothetical protein